MRRLSLILAAVVLAACAKKEASAPAETPDAPAPINLATTAGTWSFKVMPADKDTVVTTFILVTTSTTAGWTMYLPGRDPITMQVMVMGDSIMADAPAYESVLRKGVKVSTNSIFHLVDGKLIGTAMAHYTVKGADSLVALRLEGVKAPD